VSTGDYSDLNRYDAAVGDPAPPFDPLRLCVYTTVALLACVLGPVALLSFAILAIAGYARARRAGLLRSRCKLGDTRLVLLYLSAIALAAAVATPFWVAFWIGAWT
jgi:hypothetical protein